MSLLTPSCCFPFIVCRLWFILSPPLARQNREFAATLAELRDLVAAHEARTLERAVAESAAAARKRKKEEAKVSRLFHVSLRPPANLDSVTPT